ncbi:MAG: Na+/H+ antiporter NhaC family protein [Pseudomonadota bacterium]|nr:Na+/H+ antiporter NhaC family protein [Pseudomonadota bacterium]
MMEPSWYSILPPILAIVLAIWSKQVILSLFAGIWMGFTLLSGWNPLTGLAASIDAVIQVFTDPGDARVLVFTLLIGSLIATIEYSGGVRGFVRYLETRRWVHTGFRAQCLAWFIGIIIFIESNITLLIAGAVCRPLFDRYRVSREKLAYLIDSTSAPVCVLIPLNAWGAVIIGLIGGVGIDNPLEVFVASIPLNLYAILAILLSALVAWKNLNFPQMQAAELRTQAGELVWPGTTPLVDVAEFDAVRRDEAEQVPSASYMVGPVLAMLIMMPIGLLITGEGDLIKGSGSIAILWAVIAGIVTAWIMLFATRTANLNQLMQVFMKGAGNLLPIAMILLLALTLGDVAKLVGTGPYLAGIASSSVPQILLAPLVFLVAGFIAFSVGSSWGTFAIMIPIAIPIATTLDLSVPLLLAAAISGGIFGDHASPISDTTVVASMASATDHIDHVRTQLPYALTAGGLAAVGFIMLSLWI